MEHLAKGRIATCIPPGATMDEVCSGNSAITRRWWKGIDTNALVAGAGGMGLAGLSLQRLRPAVVRRRAQRLQSDAFIPTASPMPDRIFGPWFF